MDPIHQQDPRSKPNNHRLDQHRPKDQQQPIYPPESQRVPTASDLPPLNDPRYQDTGRPVKSDVERDESGPGRHTDSSTETARNKDTGAGEKSGQDSDKSA